MYLSLFNLVDRPFQLTPDTDYLFLSKSHSRAMAYMDYSVWNQEGFVVITGEVGVGKTLLVHNLFSGFVSNVVVAKVFQTQLDEVEFLQAVLVEFGFNPFHAKKVELMDMLNTFLIESYRDSKQVVLLIDDAQNLDARVLEEIRMLSTLEVKKEKILHIILVGQPDLNTTLELPELEQLLQRVRLRFHIRPLTREETKDYVTHRLRIAGAGDREIFLKDAYGIIHQYTGGIPRLINSLCDTALTCAYADEITKVSREVVITAIAELGWQPFAKRQAQMERQREKNSSAGLNSKEFDGLFKLIEANTKAVMEAGNKMDTVVSPLNVIAKKLVNIELLLSGISRNVKKK